MPQKNPLAATEFAAMQRDYIDPQLTREKAQQQDWRCCYCGCEMLDPMEMPAKNSPAMERLARELGIEPFTARWQAKVGYHRATAEHKIPVSMGGTNDPDNIEVACSFCNDRRGNRPVEEARADIEELIRAGKHPCVC